MHITTDHVVLLGIYFIPAIAAMAREHRAVGAIALLNLALGWTVIGWLGAMIWALNGNTREGEPSPETHITCPDCAELILKEACVCKHCGCRLTPQS